MQAIDGMLRCPICKDFFNSAMSLPNCCHSFCSECIRRHMSYERTCPQCKSPIHGELRKNIQIDEIVSAFSSCRHHLLKLVVRGAGAASPDCSSDDSQNDVDHPTQRLTSIHRPTHKHMPLTNYHGLQLSKLRQACKKLGLQLGTREQMIFRHKEYTLQYNVQCDRRPAKIDTNSILWNVRQKESVIKRSKASRCSTTFQINSVFVLMNAHITLSEHYFCCADYLALRSSSRQLIRRRRP